MVSLMKTTSPARLSRAGFLSAILLFGSLAGLQAQTYWVGEGNYWDDTSNWSTSSGGSSGASYPNGASASAVFDANSPLEGRVIDLASWAFDLGGLTHASAEDYEIANGTINLYGNISVNGAGRMTISADVELIEGDHSITGQSGALRLAGSVTGDGSISSNQNHVLELTGNNTFTGGFQRRSGTVAVGSNSAFGSGDITLGIGHPNDSPIFRSVSTEGYTITNNIYQRSRTFTIGDAGGTNPGTLTFAGNFYFDDTNTAEENIWSRRIIRIHQTAIFQGDFYSAEGTDDKELSLLATNGASADPSVYPGAMAVFENTSTRTTTTYIGTYWNPDNSSGPRYEAGGQHIAATVKADNALGTGDIIIYSSGTKIAQLILDGGETGITLSNNVRPAAASGQVDQYITSLGGNNTITGNVQIHTSGASYYSTIKVEADTLTLSGGVSGPSPTSANLLRKTGAGTLNLTGATSGIQRFVIEEGALRAVQGTSWTGQAVYFQGGLTPANPVFETSGTFTGQLGTDVVWSATGGNSSGGFAAYGDNLDIRLNNGTSSRTWGGSSFVASGSRLVLNSTTATHRVDFRNGLNLNGNAETIHVLDNPALTSDYARISGVISGTGSSHLRKTGDGVLELTNANTYAGGTTIAAGTLLVNNTSGSGTGSGAVTINAGAALGGSGTIAGAVTLSGVHRPGNSPGIQSFGSDLTYSSGASVEWELGANTIDQGAPGSETYDQILVSGILDFSGPVSLTLSFNPAGGTVDWTDDFWAESQSWTIYTAGSPILNGGRLSLLSENWTDGFGNLLQDVRGGTFFTLEVSGNDLLLNYAAVPEPSTWALLIGGAAFLLRRRRRLIS